VPRRTYKTEEIGSERHPAARNRRPETSPMAAHILGLQRQAGNAAVSQALTVQRLWSRSGKVLRPYRVNNGTGPGQNLKWNKGSRGVGGKKQYNTGFWCTTDDSQDQLHVHMGDGATAFESDLETVFGSKNVLNWTKSTYTIP